MAFTLTVLGFIFIFGLVIGSFLNVVILRTVSGESIVFPASKCPKCQTPLKWYHNIPVLSYIFLRGKCGFCKEHISIQYPIVELLTGTLFVLLFLRFCDPFDELLGFSVMNPISLDQFILYFISIIAASLFISIAGTDIIEKKVSDVHTYSLIGLGIVTATIIYIKANGIPKFTVETLLTCPILYSIADALIAFLFIEIIARLGEFIIGTRAFGDGDSYIAAGIASLYGALIGTSSIPFYNGEFIFTLYAILSVFIISLIIASIIAIPVFIKKLISEKDISTMCSIAGFIMFAILYFFGQAAGWLDNKWLLWISTIIFAGVGIYTCIKLLLRLRHASETDNLSYLPFGPALVGAALLCLFIFPI